ncbi:MAG TPA: carboxylesterase/lipase family protein, partial [Dehalococcoidia bacterium]
VSTSYGRLRGVQGDGVIAFKGIPFAAAPQGDLRFRAPQPPAKWDGVRDARAVGPSCPQPVPMPVGGLFAGMFSARPEESGEDCLNLNVWTPGLDGARRPVMVWIHGGGFRTGSGSSPMYDGAILSKRGDTVVVTINYRLGALGYLHLPELGGANFGLLDQVAALRWVQDEIAAFGGDPGNVTIFGESAGGKSVETVMATPLSKGLFKRAILESTYGPAMDAAGAEELSAKVLEQLGLARGDVDGLRARSAREIVDAQVAVAEAQMRAPGGMAGGAMGGRAFGPTVDGEVLPRHPLQAALDGDFKELPSIIGTNLDETKLFGAMMPGARDIDEDTLLRRVSANVGDEAQARKAIAAYRSAREARQEPTSPHDVWSAIQTDRMFRYHSLKLAENQSRNQPETYVYLFTWPSPLYEGALGSCHALELPFVFGTFDVGLGQLAGDGPEARALSEKMQDAWLAFARSGNPNTTSLPAWDRYDAAGRRTLVLDRRCDVVSAPQEPERAFWD